MGVQVQETNLGFPFEAIVQAATTGAVLAKGRGGAGAAKEHDPALAQALTDGWAAAVVKEMQAGTMTAARAQQLLAESVQVEQQVLNQYYLQQSTHNWIHAKGMPTIRQQLQDIITQGGQSGVPIVSTVATAAVAAASQIPGVTSATTASVSSWIQTYWPYLLGGGALILLLKQRQGTPARKS